VVAELVKQLEQQRQGLLSRKSQIACLLESQSERTKVIKDQMQEDM